MSAKAETTDGASFIERRVEFQAAGGRRNARRLDMLMGIDRSAIPARRALKGVLSRAAPAHG